MKICLCGSTRFMDQFHEANRRLTLAGHIVYSVATVSTGDHPDLTNEQKMTLDAVHLRKIAESEAIVVVGQQEDGSIYLGESTRRELMFARVHEISIYFFEPGQPIETGPLVEFRNDVKGATETHAMREQKKKDAEDRRAEFMKHLKEEHGSALGAELTRANTTN